MALSTTYEYYPCEDERHLNGLHIQKAFGRLYNVWKIEVDPQVKAADCPEIEDEAEREELADLTVDAGAWFMVTPTVRCSLEAIPGKGWRIQLHRRARSSGNLSPIQSFTMWGMVYEIDDAYGPSLVAAHTVLEFLEAVSDGSYRLWRTADAGARALFPGVPVEQARAELDAARVTAARAWVQIADQWSHYLHQWPMKYQFEAVSAYFAANRDHPSREKFAAIEREYVAAR